jgi:hypothetical protein
MYSSQFRHCILFPMRTAVKSFLQANFASIYFAGTPKSIIHETCKVPARQRHLTDLHVNISLTCTSTTSH